MGTSTFNSFEAHNQTTEDDDVTDELTNIYNWKINDESAANVYLPFNTRNELTTKDYSDYGNDADVTGAVWVPNGIVGGAYSFDGRDDSIIISDGGAGYYNNQTASDYKEELGGSGDWDSVTVEAWIYMTEWTEGSRIVGKIPSYALGFWSGYQSRLYGAVWPYSGEIAQDPNNATLDRMRYTSADVDMSLNTWYHIAFTYESGIGIKLYLNGELVGQSGAYEGPLSPSSGEPLYIGRLVQPFAGMIDEVKIYDYAMPEQYFDNEYNDMIGGLSETSHFTPLAFVNGDELVVKLFLTIVTLMEFLKHQVE